MRGEWCAFSRVDFTMRLATEEFHHGAHRVHRGRRRQETCPLVQFWRRNSTRDFEIFRRAVSYYLVQEKVDVSTQHGPSNRSESGNASWRAFFFQIFARAF